MRKYLIGALVAFVLVITASAIAGMSGPNNGTVVEGISGMTPITIVGQDGGYPITVTGTITTTASGAATRVEGQDGGYPVAVNGSANTSSAYGQVLVSHVSVTAVPATPLVGRRAIFVQNNGPNLIRCGSDGVVTLSTGVLLAANGGNVSFDCNDVACVIRCIAATAAQIDGAGTNFFEIR